MPKKNTSLQKAVSAGSAMTGSLAVCGGIGYYISLKNENHYYLVGGLILGVIVGMYEIYKQIK